MKVLQILEQVQVILDLYLNCFKRCKILFNWTKNKKSFFLNFVKTSLKLDNLTVLCNRVEEVKDLKVDLITSRAVTNTSLLLDITKNIKRITHTFLQR